MARAVDEIVQEAKWKVKMLARTQRFYNDVLQIW